MKYTFLIFSLITTVLLGQDLKTKKVKEKLVSRSKTTRVYHVLKDNEEIRHGAYNEFCKKELVVSGHYKLGQKDGVWMYKGLTGEYFQKGTFKEGKEVGVWKKKTVKGEETIAYYNNTGRLDSSFVYNSNHVLLSTYKYNAEKKERQSIIIYNNGFKKIESSIDSLSVVKIVHPNGVVFQEQKMIDDKMISTSDYYDKDGTILRKSNFKDGKGTLLTYYINKLQEGKLVGKSAISYLNGLPNGSYIAYQENGEIYQQGKMMKGQRVGFWKEWDEDARKMKTKNYKKYNVKKAKNKRVVFENTYEDVPFSAIQNPPVLMVDGISHKFNTKKAKLKFEELIQQNLSKNFDNESLAKYVDSKDGICRIAAIFKINTYGEISDIKAKAKHPEISKAFKKALKKLPTLIPASQRGKQVNLLFALPLVFKVKSREEDPFKSLQNNNNRY